MAMAPPQAQHRISSKILPRPCLPRSVLAKGREGTKKKLPLLVKSSTHVQYYNHPVRVAPYRSCRSPLKPAISGAGWSSGWYLAVLEAQGFERLLSLQPAAAGHLLAAVYTSPHCCPRTLMQVFVLSRRSTQLHLCAVCYHQFMFC